ncbi:flagellar hook-length control protein FliK [Malikia sp.]|uniref:flagellar hook-length control protein FliK n=1 Tax=Malikia sp. TaxID=2070706 RepID=UPI0026394EA4|nr:flagellar hook-length control protein FliK [Malikia sp.]MDD2727877.1 flagellar hook-length control protein FliK [Malikia sp.]
MTSFSLPTGSLSMLTSSSAAGTYAGSEPAGAFSEVLNGQMAGGNPQPEPTPSGAAAVAPALPPGAPGEAGMPAAQARMTDTPAAPDRASVDAVDMLALMLQLRADSLAAPAPAQVPNQEAATWTPGQTGQSDQTAFVAAQAQNPATATATATAAASPVTLTRLDSRAPSQQAASAARQEDESVAEAAALAPDSAASAALAATQIAGSAGGTSQESQQERPTEREAADAATLTPDAATLALAGEQAQAMAMQVQNAAESGPDGVPPGASERGTPVATPTPMPTPVATPATAADSAAMVDRRATGDSTGENRGDSASANAASDARAQQGGAAPELPVTTSGTRHDVSEAQGIAPAAPMAPRNPALESTAANVPTVRHEILTGFGNRGWDQAVSQRVLWLAQDQLQQASLTLNPPHLGPIQVTVQIENQQAMVQFVSAQPEVRQALQDSIPVLREMFGQAGVGLGQTDVSSHTPDQGSRQPRQAAQTTDAGNHGVAPEEASLPLPRARGQGLINLFA